MPSEKCYHCGGDGTPPEGGTCFKCLGSGELEINDDHSMQDYYRESTNVRVENLETAVADVKSDIADVMGKCDDILDAIQNP